MLLRLPPGLHYPITITELLRQPNDHIERFAPLFAYTYFTTVAEGDEWGNTEDVRKSFPARHEASADGRLLQWKITEGSVIKQANMVIAEIEEMCDHSVQFGGMCANCGMDMTRTTYVTDRLDAARATINMVHNNVSLTVSPDEAARIDDEAKRRLIQAKKLSLVVDLDQTIIHATVDPTVGDWQADFSNPNHNALKDVRAFLLKDDGSSSKVTGCKYYIKLRPGLKDFLDNTAKLYELHIYTMGTRAYAENIANIIDPDHKIFGDRILSRDESGSMTAKNLHRLFPVDTRMVVIIDDRGDIWKWSPNLIKVTPYDFFVGIGDINSSFLPKRPRLETTPKAEAAILPSVIEDVVTSKAKPQSLDHSVKPAGSHLPVASSMEGTQSIQDQLAADNKASPLDHLVAMSGHGDSLKRQAQTDIQEEVIAVQQEEKPLLQRQKQLEADDAAAVVGVQDEAGDSHNLFNASTALDKQRHTLLQDHDQELFQLQISLRTVHTAFFQAYRQHLAAAQGGRLGKLVGGQKQRAPKDKSDLDLVPDIKSILPAIKSRVLSGTKIVFSGIVPLGLDIRSSDIAILARTFGADIGSNVTRSTTHVVAARNRTQKVRIAVRKGRGRIKIVSPQWLIESMTAWHRKNEVDYLLEMDEVEEEEEKEEEENGSMNEAESEAPCETAILSDTGSESSSSDSQSALSENFFSPQPEPHPKLAVNPGVLALQDSALGPEVQSAPRPDFKVDERTLVGGTNEDWSAMNNELADFLGSELDDCDDSDTSGDGADSEDEPNSRLSIRGKKRCRLQDEGDSELGSGDGGDQSHIDKKRPLAETGNNPQSQRNVANPDVEKVDAESNDAWEEFAHDLEAEMQKATRAGSATEI